jgi:RsiW-degrading membrane proteinase PrsW (M82 family)
VTTYKLLSLILVSLPILKVIAAVNGVVTAAFGSILFNFFYRNCSSDCITIPSRSTIVGALIG